MKATLALLAAALIAGPALGATKPAAKPVMATHTTKTGKKITYNCAKKGNATKTACKKAA